MYTNDYISICNTNNGSHFIPNLFYYCIVIKTILLIEDDAIWQIKICDLLHQINPEFIIHTCANIEDSLLYLESMIPDLMICDVMLEEELVFDLFIHPEYKKIPCIFMTMSEDANHYAASKEIEESLFINKPVKLLSLASAIDTIFQNYTRRLGKNPKGILVKGSHNQKIRLKLEDIIIVESEFNYCIFKTSKNKYALKASLIKIQEELGPDMIQIHKKYLVNKKFIQNINLSLMAINTMIGNFPIGRKFKVNVLNYMEEKRNLE